MFCFDEVKIRRGSRYGMGSFIYSIDPLFIVSPPVEGRVLILRGSCSSGYVWCIVWMSTTYPTPRFMYYMIPVSPVSAT